MTFFRSIGVVAGCLSAGKIVQNFNQYLLLGASLLVVGVCLMAAPFCGNTTTFTVTMVTHGFFTAFHAVGKTPRVVELFLLSLSVAQDTSNI